MSYISRRRLQSIAKKVQGLALDYKTIGKGELPVDRILYGYLCARFPKVKRQHQIRSEKATRRIDFLVGSEKLGTFIELVVRHSGQEWQKSQNGKELNKLVRATGRVRVLLVIDVSGYAAVHKADFKRNYTGWKSTRGRFTRKHISIVYASSTSVFSFGLKTGKAGARPD